MLNAYVKMRRKAGLVKCIVLVLASTASWNALQLRASRFRRTLDP